MTEIMSHKLVNRDSRFSSKQSRKRRRISRRKALPYQLGIALIAILGLLTYNQLSSSSFDNSLQGNRNLEETVSDYDATCGKDFPYDGFSLDDQRNGWFLIHIGVMFYMFIALAIVCDEYFVSALEVICEKLDMSDDVAGATFMAAGGSAPELFTSIIGVFVTKSEIGFGTIVGSAVFNVLFVIGLCAVVAGPGLPLTWYPLARDSMYYTVSLCLLAYFVMDNTITWIEALIMFIMYIGYVILMMKNEKIKAWAMHVRNSNIKEHAFYRRSSSLKSSSIVPAELLTKAEEDSENVTAHEDATVAAMAESVGTGCSPGDETAKKDTEGNATTSANTIDLPEEDTVEVADDDDDEVYNLAMPDTISGKIVYVLIAPLTFTLYFTIPDCRKEERKSAYYITFMLSILYIGLSSYVMVWMASEVGCTFGVTESVMGITVLAAGTSIPDALSSMIVTREGHGDMAVSSSIGSNIFDICMGLPLPWLLNATINAFYGNDTSITIKNDTMWISVVTLLGMLLCTVLSIHFSGWMLNRNLGIICATLYFVFIAETLWLDTL